MNNQNQIAFSLIDILGLIVYRIRFVIIAIIFCSIAFLIYNRFIDKPIYKSSAVIIRSNKEYIYYRAKTNQQQQDNNLFIEQIADLSNADLLPSIVKSDIFIERLLRKEFYSKFIDKKTQLLFILSKDKTKFDYIEKIDYAKRKLKNSINLIDNGTTITIQTKSQDAKLAKDLVEQIISEIIQTNSLFKQQTLSIQKEIVEGKIDIIKNNLNINEKNLMLFLEQNGNIDSPSLLLKYESLKREIEINKNIYMQLSKNYDLLNIELRNRSKNTISILDYPTTPISPSNSNFFQALIKGSLFGLVVSLFIIIIHLFYIDPNQLIEGKINLT